MRRLPSRSPSDLVIPLKLISPMMMMISVVSVRRRVWGEGWERVYYSINVNISFERFLRLSQTHLYPRRKIAATTSPVNSTVDPSSQQLCRTSSVKNTEARQTDTVLFESAFLRSCHFIGSPTLVQRRTFYRDCASEIVYQHSYWTRAIAFARAKGSS